MGVTSTDNDSDDDTDDEDKDFSEFGERVKGRRNPVFASDSEEKELEDEDDGNEEKGHKYIVVGEADIQDNEEKKDVTPRVEIYV